MYMATIRAINAPTMASIIANHIPLNMSKLTTSPNSTNTNMFAINPSDSHISCKPSWTSFKLWCAIFLKIKAANRTATIPETCSKCSAI